MEKEIKKRPNLIVFHFVKFSSISGVRGHVFSISKVDTE